MCISSYYSSIICTTDLCNYRFHIKKAAWHCRLAVFLSHYHTGGRKHAKLARIQAEQCYLPALLGEKIGANFTGKDEQHSKTFVVAAVYERTLFIMTDKGTSAQRFHFVFSQG